MKQCANPNCPVPVQPEANFSRHKGRRGGLAPYCKICAAEKQREWRKNNPERARGINNKSYKNCAEARKDAEKAPPNV